MAKTFIILGSAFGFLGVALGAFGAHGLRERLSDDMMAIYQTGIQYHLIHALAILAVGILLRNVEQSAAPALVRLSLCRRRADLLRQSLCVKCNRDSRAGSDHPNWRTGFSSPAGHAWQSAHGEDSSRCI